MGSKLAFLCFLSFTSTLLYVTFHGDIQSAGHMVITATTDYSLVWALWRAGWLNFAPMSGDRGG